MTQPLILIRVPQDLNALPAARAAIRAMADQVCQLASDFADQAEEEAGHVSDLWMVRDELDHLAAHIKAHLTDMEQVPDPDGGLAFLSRTAKLLGEITGRLAAVVRAAGISVDVEVQP